VADSGQVRVGELAIAVGNPLGFVGALTTGVVHAVGPLAGLGAGHGYRRISPRARQLGGPLADARGRIIGINTMIAGGLALAVPSNVVKTFLEAGVSGPRLGVTVRPVMLDRRTVGLLLLGVEPGGAAEAARC